MATKKPTAGDLSKLFQSGGASLGLDDEGSSTLIANLNGTTVPMCIGDPFDDDEKETDDFRLVLFLLDGSTSMEGVEDVVRETMNDIVFPGLLGGARNQVGAIRYSGLKFASTVTPLWGGGWKKLDDKSPRLTVTDYSANGSTALNKGVLDAITAMTAQAVQIRDTTGTSPECVIAALSDGANNQPPADAGPVKAVMDQLSDELFTKVFIGFQTFEPVDFKAVAASLGFRDIMDSKAKPGETKDEMRRRFRHVMKVFSSQIVKRASSSRVGTSVPTTGGTGFFDD